MANCHYCDRYVPDDVARCPHCYTLIEEEAAKGTRRGRKGTKGRTIPSTIAGMPSRRFAILGCFGLILLTVGCAAVFAVVAPDTARSLIAGRPTPVPPTPRPSPTPSPAPTATPRWLSYDGANESYWIKYSPYWVVINFADPEWAYTLARESRRRPWLVERLPEEKKAAEAELQSTWGLDPLASPIFSIRSWTDPTLAEMTAQQLRDDLSETLLESLPTYGGRVQGGVRGDLTELDGKEAALFEVTIQPGADAEVNELIQIKFYALSDEKQGYWIEVIGTQRELEQGQAQIQAVIESFHIIQPRK